MATANCDNWKRTENFVITLVRYKLVEQTRTVGRIRLYKVIKTGRVLSAIVNHPAVRGLYETENEEDVFDDNGDSIASLIDYLKAISLE
ncbi:MAG: hypothetical protein ACRD5J_07215 [Nitrososphaeraceae archaeon]